MDHILKDIDTVHRHVEKLRATLKDNRISQSSVSQLLSETDDSDMNAFHAAMNWVQNGMASIFLQDANSLILKPEDLIRILEHIRACFPWVSRITSYARSHTVARISHNHMKKIRQAGLSRIHIGMESASDKVLENIRKGTTKAMQIKAGLYRIIRICDARSGWN
jgi:uncharacterized Fe-S cluster-containing MiaB family protein